jgi:hypothetical protein
VVAKLRAMRGRGESYSNVSLRQRQLDEAHTDFRASSTFEGGGTEQRMIPVFLGKWRKSILRRKSIPHSDYLFRTALH